VVTVETRVQVPVSRVTGVMQSIPSAAAEQPRPSVSSGGSWDWTSPSIEGRLSRRPFLQVINLSVSLKIPVTCVMAGRKQWFRSRPRVTAGHRHYAKLASGIPNRYSPFSMSTCFEMVEKALGWIRPSTSSDRLSRTQTWKLNIHGFILAVL